MPQRLPFISRYFYKALHELLPATIASMLGAMVLNYYNHTSVGSQPTAIKSVESVANSDLMQMVRDEHSLIVDYLKRRSEAEQERNRSADDDMSKSKAVQHGTVFNSHELKPVRSKATALLRREIANSIRRTQISRHQPIPMAEYESLQRIYGAMIAPPVEAADYPVPPALIPNVTSSFNSKMPWMRLRSS
jgi:hypothetical protein